MNKNWNELFENIAESLKEAATAKISVDDECLFWLADDIWAKVSIRGFTTAGLPIPELMEDIPSIGARKGDLITVKLEGFDSIEEAMSTMFKDVPSKIDQKRYELLDKFLSVANSKLKEVQKSLDEIEKKRK